VAAGHELGDLDTRRVGFDRDILVAVGARGDRVLGVPARRLERATAVRAGLRERLGPQREVALRVAVAAVEGFAVPAAPLRELTLTTLGAADADALLDVDDALARGVVMAAVEGPE